MTTTKISVEKRAHVGSSYSRQLRRAGRVPAVVYGAGEPEHVSIAMNDAASLLASRERVVTLELAGAKPQKVLVKDAHHDTFGDEIQHLDFQRVSDDTVVRLRVPLAFEGTAKGTLTGGITEVLRFELPIECKAKDVPLLMTIPVDELDVGKVLHAGILPLPKGVSLARGLDPKLPVVACRVTKRKLEKEEEVAAPTEEAAAAEGAAAAAPAPDKKAEKKK